jgi:hypothetical protein
MLVKKIAGVANLPQQAEQVISTRNWVEAPGVEAGFAIRHDETSIYLYYQVTEPQVRAVNTRINSPVWEDSCVEFFLQINEEEQYYNFEFNAIGTVLGGYGKDRHKRFQLSDRLLALIDATPSLGNSPIESLDKRTFWSLRLIIPVRVLHFSKIASLSGVDARANFYKCGDKLNQPHFLSWKPVLTPEPDFHQPKYFGVLAFQ